MSLSRKKLRLEIQSIRPTIIRAKIQVGRKLIMDIKKLSNKKVNNDSKNEKNKRKIERLSDEIHVLRKLNANAIANFALLHSTESVEKLREHPDAAVQVRILSKVSLHQLVKPLVKEFHKKYPKWEDSLAKLLMQRKSISVQNKFEFKVERKPQKEEKITIQIKKPKISLIKTQLKGNSNEWLVKTVTESTKNSSITRKLTNESPVESNEGKYCYLNPSKDVENSLTEVINSFKYTIDLREKINNEEILKKTEQQEDPFFITSDNKKYMTLGKIIDETKDELFTPVNERYHSKTKKDGNNFNKLEKANKFWNNNLERKPNNYTNFDEKKEILHPSWEAKRKKSSILPFEGKKISFDI